MLAYQLIGPLLMRISVIVPVRDEAQSISALLEGLLAQSRPPDEIVIADGGSIDETAAIAVSPGRLAVNVPPHDQ